MRPRLFIEIPYNAQCSSHKAGPSGGSSFAPFWKDEKCCVISRCWAGSPGGKRANNNQRQPLL